MTAKRFFLPFVLAGALLAVAGCDDKKPDQPKVDATPKAPTAGDMKAGMDKAAASSAGDTVKASPAGDAAAAAKTQAGEWMAKLEQAIKDNKLDEAKTYMDKLQSMRASLPAEWQTKLDSLKTLYEGAKAKAAIPGLNK
jgi:hypothetical protein